MARELGSRVELAPIWGSSAVYGTIIEVHEVPNHPQLAEYSVEWDDGLYPNEIWTEQDFKAGR